MNDGLVSGGILCIFVTLLCRDNDLVIRFYLCVYAFLPRFIVHDQMKQRNILVLSTRITRIRENISLNPDRFHDFGIPKPRGRYVNANF